MPHAIFTNFNWRRRPFHLPILQCFFSPCFDRLQGGFAEVLFFLIASARLLNLVPVLLVCTWPRPGSVEPCFRSSWCKIELPTIPFQQPCLASNLCLSALVSSNGMWHLFSAASPSNSICDVEILELPIVYVQIHASSMELSQADK